MKKLLVAPYLMFINSYSNLSISKSGVMTNYPRTFWGAHFNLDNDVSQLFPYINAIVEDAKYYEKPECIEFILNDFKCMLYPNEVIAAYFTGKDQALEFAQQLIDFLNDLHAKKSSLKPNYKKYRTVSIIDIYKILPQTNCQECGFSTCLAFAAALCKKETDLHQCPGLSRPIYNYAVFPAFDKNGNLAATVAVEVEATKELPENRNLAVPNDLTEREIQVLRLVAAGATNIEISAKLSISPHTVKSHVVHMFNKLGVNDRTEAAVWAARHKLV